jgi:hypothetical protein
MTPARPRDRDSDSGKGEPPVAARPFVACVARQGARRVSRGTRDAGERGRGPRDSLLVVDRAAAGAPVV